MMEKRGVIDENTPDCGPCQQGEPGTKEAADRMESHPVNRLIDEVAERSQGNKKARS